MRIQESLLTDKQIALELFSENGRYRLPIEGKDYYFPALEKVHEAFLNQNTYDTIKLTYEGKKSYLHLFMDEIEVFDTKKALRQRLSQDSQGMWAEIRNGQKHYYIQQRGWISTSYKEITEQQCHEKLQHTSTMTKALGIGLGIFALLPGAVEFARHLPISTKEAAMGLIALNQKSPVLGAVGYSLLPKRAEAQAVGTEFQVNTYTTSWQSSPSIAPLKDGGFVVVWQSLFQDGDDYGIFGQRYDRNGTPSGFEFQINSYTRFFQDTPSIASLDDGGFVVTWRSDGQDGNGWGIYGQRYDSSGMPAGLEFQVNTYATDLQESPSVAPLNNGGFAVTWVSHFQDGNDNGIYGQRFDSSGVPSGSEFQVNTYASYGQEQPSIAALKDGGFVITWQSNNQDGSRYGVYAQRYDSIGAPVSSEFQVNTYTTNGQEQPSIAPLSDGGFIITWQSDGQDGDNFGIFGQRFDSNGAPMGNEFQVNTYTTGHQRNPRVAPLNDGGFVVTWESNGQDADLYGIFAQRYDSTGATVGSEFRVNSYESNSQYTPTIAPLNDGGFVITWQSDLQDGDGWGIYGQRYDENGTAIALQIPILSSTPTPIPIGNSKTSSSSTASSTLPVLNAPTTSTSSSTQPSPTTILSVESMVYEESYPILVNGETVGTYTVSGGTGFLNNSSPNVIYFEFDPSFQPEEGDVITLFYIPEEQVGLWEGIEIENKNFECLEALSEISTNGGLSSFQMFFEDTKCSAIAPAMLATALPLTLN